ncbi:exosortase/archaeosortase family protein [Haloferula chungangensis]|uniref:Exosortase/archaeosortase family protein n=1 Tax=Haloferula chungangensis TaxID=1048331 RepID=A0ABW2L6U7_9BACT
MSSQSSAPVRPNPPGWVILLVLLWAQLFGACIYAWKFGEYYDYGWFIPPLFAWFLWRLRKQWMAISPPPLSQTLVLVGMLGLAALLFCLRVVEKVDPRWTLPIWIHALGVIAITLFITVRTGGSKAAVRIIPILLFACTAIPLPTLIENFLVSSLTDGVVGSSAALLQFLGMQVQTMGDRLAFMNEVVEVTDGCSGIRSAQSFLMSSLFFGELMRLQAVQRLILVGIGVAVAWVLNVIRASALAAIQFKSGQEAFDQAHDQAGLIAFAVGSVVLLAVSSWISRPSRRTVMRKQVGKGDL